MVVFKLKAAINVDELYALRNFEYKRKSTRQGKTHVDLIGCKIKGLRAPGYDQQQQQHRQPMSGYRTAQDDGIILYFGIIFLKKRKKKKPRCGIISQNQRSYLLRGS